MLRILLDASLLSTATSSYVDVRQVYGAGLQDRYVLDLIALTHVWEEPAVSYRWTDWVWEINRWKLETSGELQIILEEYIEYTSKMSEAKLEDVNM